MRGTCVLLVLAALGCDSGGTDAPAPDGGVPDAILADAFVDQSGPLFEPNHIVQVAITMAEVDWDAMRVQTREILSVLEGNCLAQPAPSPFTTFHASVTVDGSTFADIGIKKKGFLGSLDATKPSLKLKLDEFVAGQEYLGLEKITLNNSHQDPSLVRQCVAYQVFAGAGIVAPRCNFAHVTINGRDLGIFVNVESLDHHMTKSHYADGTGNLYEGTLSDFRHNWTGTFDSKGGGDGSDLLPLTNVLDNSPDATLVADLAPYIDLDRFITFWAMEILTNHWDGYANDHNNFFVYHDPTTDKLDFIPWGPDGTMQPGATFGALGSTTGPIAVAANGALAYRLFAVAATRQQFLARQRTLLTTAWSESAILAEIQRMETLISPAADAYEGTGWHAAVDSVRTFVQGRRAALTAALDAGPTWTDPVSAYPCLDLKAHVTGTFNTQFGTMAADPFTAGTGTMSITINGVTTPLTPVGAKAGYDPNPAPNTTAAAIVQVFGKRASDNHIFAVSVSMPPSRFFPRMANLGFFDAFGGLFDYDPGTNTTALVGFMLGTLQLTQASTTGGATVAGSFDADALTQGTPPP